VGSTFGGGEQRSNALSLEIAHRGGRLSGPGDYRYVFIFLSMHVYLCDTLRTSTRSILCINHRVGRGIQFLMALGWYSSRVISPCGAPY
jgi:hypothetical protein